MAVLARRLVPGGEWEDVLQEAVTAAWAKWTSFDPGRGSARNWLLAIVADRAHKHHRRRRPEPVADPPDSAGPDSDGSGRLDLDSAFTGLTERQLLAVTLHYFVGLPLADIAVVMACGEGTVKSTLRDARAKLRKDLGEDYR
ncbi:sigma-70 family RNA polymerase sigma factor [Nakamurella sp. YIM 132087]|uniref:Sigma-70 family RNA polymerase sigma factor n=2 Tax=Nakamurella alba TaxID=2665158 RepID=A0A7K1FEX0_9ACTN|nr:sigma-70 family RNA polymerase sigma factor [Nakamurella alba]